MLPGALYNFLHIPSQLWLNSWIRRIVSLEILLCVLITKGFFSLKINNRLFSLYFSWSKVLFKNPSSLFSFPLSYLFLNILKSFKNSCVGLYFNFVTICGNNYYPFLEFSLLHGQTKRWGPVGFFMRWWVVVTSNLIMSTVDTNKMPHDFWLLEKASFYDND